MYKRGELRREIRLPIEVILSTWESPVLLKTTDFSPAGAYIESEVLPDDGETLVCCFGLSRPDEYCVFATVARVNPLRRRVESASSGFGIFFKDLSSFQRLEIRQRLRGLPPPVPKPGRDDDPLHLGWLC